MTTREHQRQQWDARITEYRTSGQTLKAWCAAHGYTVDQMKYWLYKSGKRGSTLTVSAPANPPATHFVPLTVAEEANRPSLVLYIGPTRIELHNGFDPRLLREVVHALSEAVLC